MRFYGGKFVSNRFTAITEKHSESQDAIIFDIDSTAQYCRCKVQNSTRYVRAFYPENWEQTPTWLKPGNAVKITHRGGVRGRIEVIGHGQVVPIPVSGVAAPTPITGPDGVLSGCGVVQIPANAEMKVGVNVGTYRLNGTVLTLDAIAMDNTALEMDMAFEMGAVHNILPIATITTVVGNYRYDIIAGGTDTVVHVVQGTTATASPTMPATPADHVRMNWILLYGGMSCVMQADIGKVWQAPTPSQLSIVASDTDMDWAASTAALAFTIKDQYGQPITQAAGYSVKCEFMAGNGQITDSALSSTSSLTAFTTRATYTFGYTRGGATTDESPVFKGELVGEGIIGSEIIWLRNSSGEIM